MDFALNQHASSTGALADLLDFLTSFECAVWAGEVVLTISFAGVENALLSAFIARAFLDGFWSPSVFPSVAFRERFMIRRVANRLARGGRGRETDAGRFLECSLHRRNGIVMFH